MRRTIPSSHFRRPLLAALLLGLCSPLLAAQTQQITYHLDDVWLKPDISHPREAALQMTGTFVWSYTAGQFESGSGKFTSLSIPWWGTRTTPTVKIVFDPKAIEFSMVGNYHGLGLDVKMALAPKLSPKDPSPIDKVASKFTIEVGVSRKGHFTKGRVLPLWKPSVVSTGSGCTGVGGTVTQVANGLPTLGNQGFGLTVANAPQQSPALLLLAAGQLATPIPLHGTCLLYVDPLKLALVLPSQVSTTGSASWPLPIPTTTSLLGVAFHTQALAVTPALKFLASNALESKIGN